MGYGRNFYTAFWTAFRAAHPNIPCHSGVYRQPTHVGQNYIGHRIGGPVYVHMWFTGHGATRTLIVEAYTSNANHPRWITACNNLTPPPHNIVLVPDPTVGGQAARLVHIVAGPLTAAQAQQQQANLIAQFAAAYNAVRAAA
jgi:hypothetical protein